MEAQTGHSSRPPTEGMDRGYRFHVNGRALPPPLTGVERYTSAIVTRLEGVVDVVHPPDGLSERQGWSWEQEVLPRELEGRLWSPANLGPVDYQDQVVTLHDVAPLDHPEWFNPAFAAYFRRVVPRLVRRVRRVICVSAFTRDRLLANTDLDPERTLVIPNGVDARFQPADGPAVEALLEQRLPGVERFVLCLGTLEPRKNLSRLLSAWRSSRNALPHHELVLAGGSPPEAIFNGWGLDGGLDDVRWIGRVPDEELPALYTAADLLVYPSVYEGFGLPPLEAMACGTLALVSDHTPAARLVEEPYRVPPDDGDAWARALLDHADRGERVCERRRRSLVERHDWARIARRTRQAILAP